MNDLESLKHTRWECKYHIVFIPKRRRKMINLGLRKELGSVLRELVGHREGKIEEGHLMMHHVHMLVSIPPKYSVSQVVGYIKGKSAIYIARTYMGKRQNFVGRHFWARGYYVSTVGRDEETIRDYIRKQEEADERADQLEMFK
jgi:putative transposase